YRVALPLGLGGVGAQRLPARFLAGVLPVALRLAVVTLAVFARAAAAAGDLLAGLHSHIIPVVARLLCRSFSGDGGGQRLRFGDWRRGYLRGSGRAVALPEAAGVRFTGPAAGALRESSRWQ